MKILKWTFKLININITNLFFQTVMQMQKIFLWTKT